MASAHIGNGDIHNTDGDYDDANAIVSNEALAAEHARHQERLRHLVPVFAESLPDESLAAMPASMAPVSDAVCPTRGYKMFSRQWMSEQRKLRQQVADALMYDT
jgi:hypothetical protein